MSDSCEATSRKSTAKTKKRRSFVKKIRALTGSASDKTSQPTTPYTAHAPPAPPSTAGCTSSSERSIAALCCPAHEHQAASPYHRPYRSQSLGDTAGAGASATCSKQQQQRQQTPLTPSPPQPTDPLSCNVDALLGRLPARSRSLKPVLLRERGPHGDTTMPRTPSPDAGIVPSQEGATTSSLKANHSSRPNLVGSKTYTFLEKLDGAADSGPRTDFVQCNSEVVRSRRSEGGEGGGKQRPKSVCVVAPTDTMKLRRAHSEKAKTAETVASLKTAVLSRHSTITSSHSRKSLTSLALAVDPGLCPKPERGSEFVENGSRESRKSVSASTSGSVSTFGGETGSVSNSSPRMSLDSKNTCDYTDLPPYVSKSKNAKFHKLFKNVPTEEYPIDTYSCAFKGDILLQGMMYVSHNWICFYSKIRARGRLLEIPLEKVISITREKLALIIPNAIGIQMADQKYVFGSFMSRDNTYKMLVTLLKHTQDSTDSTSTKGNELSCYDNLANRAGRRSLSTESQDPEDMTHSADISAESDTTEDDDSDAVPEVTQSTSSDIVGRGPGCGEDKRIPELPSDKVPGFFSWKCMDYRKMFLGLSAFTLKLQKVPRTNLLLAICIVLVVFLMVSAAGLTYKVLLLQTRLEMSHLWTSASQSTVRDQSDRNMYSVHWERQRATIHHLHDMLKANLQLLEQVHQSLKSLESCAAGKDQPPAK